MKKHEERKYFITGLLIILPVLVTTYLFISLFAFFDNILGRYISKLTVAYFGYKIPGLGLLVFVALIFFAGFFATNFIGRKFLLYLEGIWFKFPLIKKVYPAAKQVINFLFSHKLQNKLQRVVLVEYPRKGLYSLGFATNHADSAIQEKIPGKEFFNILIPSVPNPLTGILVIVPSEEVIFLDMSLEDAVKIVVSGGVLNPKDLLGQNSEKNF